MYGNRRRHSVFAAASSPHMEEYGPNGGFRIRYPDADTHSVASVRQYRARLIAEYPGWMSSLEFQDGDLLLSVYPAQEAPSVLTRHLLRPAWQ